MDHKAFKELRVQRDIRVRKVPLLWPVLKVPRVIEESLDILALLGQKVGQDLMAPLALLETLGHQVLGLQDHVVLKVTQVLLDRKDLQAL